MHCRTQYLIAIINRLLSHFFGETPFMNKPSIGTVSALVLSSLLAASAHATVIYTDLTSAPLVIDYNNPVPGSESPGLYNLDIDGDSTGDVYLTHESELASAVPDGAVNVRAFLQPNASGVLNQGVAINLTDIGLAYPPALVITTGTRIDSSLTFTGIGLLGSNRYDSGLRSANEGAWANGGAGFRGLVAVSWYASTSGADPTTYAWMDIGISPYSPTDPSSFAITLYRYAYESTVGVGIDAGQTSSPASVPEPSTLLLTSVAALALRQRRKPSAA